MAFVGKVYAHEKDENFAEFVDTLGVAADRVASFKQFKPSQTLEKNGDVYTLIAKGANETKQVSFKMGEEFDETLSPTRVAKTTFNLDGNVLNQVQKFQDGHVVTTKREYLDDKLIVTLEHNKWDGKAVRYYKA
ncbi:fatty acid-binding protein 2-like isoform X1 [Battus philenor]|uniref:fatty acid-binding protein 2-like isoform X1 n=1 Tax=Battus philenor TaxID=42288 RepID=UPI0035D0B567